jgi:hypothetical protein
MPEQLRIAEVIPPGQSNNLPAVAYYPPISHCSRNSNRKLPRFPCRIIFGSCGGIAGRWLLLLQRVFW